MIKFVDYLQVKSPNLRGGVTWF